MSIWDMKKRGKVILLTLTKPDSDGNLKNYSFDRNAGLVDPEIMLSELELSNPKLSQYLHQTLGNKLEVLSVITEQTNPEAFLRYAELSAKLGVVDLPTLYSIHDGNPDNWVYDSYHHAIQIPTLPSGQEKTIEFLIAHELHHAKNRDRIPKPGDMSIVKALSSITGLAATAIFFFAPVYAPSVPRHLPVDILALSLATLTGNWVYRKKIVPRRLEYEADKEAALITGYYDAGINYFKQVIEEEKLYFDVVKKNRSHSVLLLKAWVTVRRLLDYHPPHEKRVMALEKLKRSDALKLKGGSKELQQ